MDAGEANPEVVADQFDACFLFGGDANPENRPAALPGMDLEEAFQIVGEFGPYQKRAVAVLVVTQVGKHEVM